MGDIPISKPAKAFDNVLKIIKNITGFDEIATVFTAAYSLWLTKKEDVMSDDNKQKIIAVANGIISLLHAIIEDVKLCDDDGVARNIADKLSITFSKGAEGEAPANAAEVEAVAAAADDSQTRIQSGGANKSTMKFKKYKPSRKFNGINLAKFNTNSFHMHGNKTRNRIIQKILQFTRKKY